MNSIKENAEVGIGVLTYNAEKHLHECLNSLLAQTYANTQIVVSDDCSQDGTQEILKAYAKNHPNKFRVIINEKNLGIQPNTNSCLKALNSPLVSIIAGDDYWRSDKLEREVLAMKRSPNARWSYSQIATVDDQGCIIDKAHPLSKGPDERLPLLKKALCHELIVLNWTIDKSLMRELNYIFDESLVYIGDWDYLVRLIDKSNAVFCSESTVFYRRHKKSITFKGDMRLYYLDFIKAYKKHRDKLYKLTEKDRSDVLYSQRKMLKSTIQQWLLDSIQKKNFKELIRCLYLKLVYKFSPIS
ncbi:MAG: glycosyltransferase [Opitutae bacterium]|jgi:glycosyltransferase involved in cell wall biosynthesis|nr:glycosyltransferase [Opitutae bacterium]MBT5690565.1 glycosyltransferase [Opitutae bacterium]MBT7854318.1 glycosyltransferase [Opitutae bacterium]